MRRDQPRVCGKRVGLRHVRDRRLRGPRVIAERGDRRRVLAPAGDGRGAASVGLDRRRPQPHPTGLARRGDTSRARGGQARVLREAAGNRRRGSRRAVRARRVERAAPRMRARHLPGERVPEGPFPARRGRDRRAARHLGRDAGRWPGGMASGPRHLLPRRGRPAARHGAVLRDGDRLAARARAAGRGVRLDLRRRAHDQGRAATGRALHGRDPDAHHVDAGARGRRDRNARRDVRGSRATTPRRCSCTDPTASSPCPTRTGSPARCGSDGDAVPGKAFPSPPAGPRTLAGSGSTTWSRRSRRGGRTARQRVSRPTSSTWRGRFSPRARAARPSRLRPRPSGPMPYPSTSPAARTRRPDGGEPARRQGQGRSLLARGGGRHVVPRPERQRRARPVRGRTSAGRGSGRRPPRPHDARGEGGTALPSGPARAGRRRRRRGARRVLAGRDASSGRGTRPDPLQHLLGPRARHARRVAQPDAGGGRGDAARDPGHDLVRPPPRPRRQPRHEHGGRGILQVARPDRAGRDTGRGPRARVRRRRATASTSPSGSGWRCTRPPISRPSRAGAVRQERSARTPTSSRAW